MKKILTILTISTLLLSGFGVTAFSSEKQLLQKEEHILLNTPYIKDVDDRTSVFLKEADTYLNNPGRPVLPVIVKTYTFPLGTLIENVQCLPNEIHTQKISTNIEYAYTPIPKIADYTVKKTIEDPKIYSSSAWYPQSWFSYNVGVGLNGKDHVVYLTVHFYPVQYSPAQNLIQYTTKANVLIDFVKPKHQPMFTDVYDLVIIAPKSYSRSLQPLVEHKEAMGVTTKLMTTEEIYQDFDGRDEAEQIKYFIQYAIEEWDTSYVLLFGGMKGQRYWSWQVPMRYSNLDDASDWETTYLSDLYFADVYKYSGCLGYEFDDWDSNGNDIFAEWNTDNVDVLDMFPDVYVGRLPVRYRFQVKDIVDRIINYETTAYGSEWFNRMAVIGGDSFDDISWNTSTDYIEGQEETAHALSYMDGFDQTRIWVEGGDVQFTPQNTEEVLSEGAGFVLFSGHGNPASWATHPHANFSVWIDFGLKNISNLQNGDKLPVMIVGGCHNSQFDTSLIRLITQWPIALYLGEFAPKCWSWKFASEKNGGSIASIGCSGLGYGSIGDGPDPPDEIPESMPDGIPDCIQYLGGWIEGHFFEVYNDSGIDILGETHGTTITDYLNEFLIDWEMDWDDHENFHNLVDAKTAQEWVLMGDPSLKIGGYQ